MKDTAETPAKMVCSGPLNSYNRQRSLSASLGGSLVAVADIGKPWWGEIGMRRQGTWKEFVADNQLPV